MSQADPMIGKQFGSRTVLARAGSAPSRAALYLCRCVCGREDVVLGAYLRKGSSIKCLSCSASQTKNRKTHGLSKTSVYASWKSMISRCSVPTNPAYKDYGARGITVCDAWKDFSVFYNWALANGWAPGLSIDRIDVNAGYSPDNCRWATRAQQRENVRLLTKANTSGYRGVSKKTGRQQWLARVSVDRKILHIGHFASAQEAAKAYDAYVLANNIKRPLNFPNHD